MSYGELVAGRVCIAHATKQGILEDEAGRCHTGIDIALENDIEPTPKCPDCPIIEEAKNGEKPDSEEWGDIVSWNCSRCKHTFKKPIEERPVKCEGCHKNLDHTNEIELVKQHGDIISKSMARALEKYATEDSL